MQISLNWLRSLLDIQLSAAEIARILTSTGLEVEHFETTYSVKGGLKDLRVAEVLEKWKHPNADKLNVTKVNLGSEIVQIVCGASNVDAGQKVVVAPVGAFVHPIKGDAFQIQKAKIRGEVSEGMICAEDEISLGESHAGIMVLPSDAKVGTLASEYFKIQEDTIFEIGLTPNRADAASHWGVARDIIAYAELHNIPYKVKLEKSPKVNYGTKDFQVNVLSKEAAPRFAGLVLSNIQVSDSPDWLRNALLSIGLSPINNIVDITNYIQHTLGQPMHAYDMSYVGNAINVEVLDKPQEFEFLDGKKSKETQGDLFICNAQHQPMCLAGIFGGKHSGVGTNTTSIFLEAAYFNPVQIRKSSKKHGLKTDASFRFERGVDIQNTVNALNFAAKLILDICPKAVIESKLIDIQQDTVANKEVKLSLTNLKRLAGFEVETDKLNKILKGLEIEMKSKSADEYHLSIPRYRVDLDREIDVIEDILRIYGFDNIPFSSHIALNLNGKKIENFDKEQKKLSNYLVSQGFYEIMNNSLGAQKFEKGVEAVQLLNPLSNELNTLRTHLLSGHLQTIAFNQNRKNANARFFEFGSVYSKKGAEYQQEQRLLLSFSGNFTEKAWNQAQVKADYFQLKGWLIALLQRLNLKTKEQHTEHAYYTDAISFNAGKLELATIGIVKAEIKKQFDIQSEVFVADVNWENIIQALKQVKPLTVTDIPKFPHVERDLALLVNDDTQANELIKMANSLSNPLIKNVKVFDVYRGDKLPQGKKSYAINFTIQDELKTLVDTEIDAVMQSLIALYTKSGFELRN